MKTTLSPNIENRLDLLREVIQKNKNIITSTTDAEAGKKTYCYNSRVVISESIDFLEAIRKELGGEIINSKAIGAFLYLD
jgi:hypothetical protein